MHHLDFQKNKKNSPQKKNKKIASSILNLEFLTVKIFTLPNLTEKPSFYQQMPID